MRARPGTTFTHLLAKSTPDPEHPAPGCTLVEHTLATVRASEVILHAAGAAVLSALELEVDEWSGRLHRAAVLAAFLHDLGKGNDHFQRMVRGRRGSGFTQAHRHELLSLWLAGGDGPLGDWLLAGADDVVRTAVLCAVAGHHLKFDTGAMPYPSASPRPLTLLCTHPDFERTIAAGAAQLGLPVAPPLGEPAFEPADEPLADACRPTLIRLMRALRAGGQPKLRRFVGAVKAITMASDVVASADLRGTLRGGAVWLAAGLGATCSSDELEGIARHRLGGGEPRPFQAQTGASVAPVTLVRAGCGSGKTVAAYLWAARRAAGRKLFVCYPTTGTATEGYADYVFGEDVDGLLAHSRAEVDLEHLLESGDEDAFESARQWAAVDRALRIWLPTVVVCTADAVLGLLQNYRSGLFAFPAIAGGAFVFDEIHQYDDRMFSALCRFLDELPGTPVLLMTASLQPHRRDALRHAAERRGHPLPEIGGPPELETGQRYVLRSGTADEAEETALDTLARGGKVLWVCNTVGAAMAYADHFAGLGARPLTYHSRFRYEDRVGRHRAVVEAFRRAGAMVAVTTQVCEVSLDLSADLLISEMAPAPAMIQRLGRLNRRFDPQRPETRPAIFVEPTGHLPYALADLETAREWLRRLGRGPVSQHDLADVFETLAVEPPRGLRVEHAWLDAAPFAPRASLREAEGSVPIILPHEAAACRGAGGMTRTNEIVRRSIPMPLWPVRDEIERWERIGMAFVPPIGRVAYSAERGAQWVK